MPSLISSNTLRLEPDNLAAQSARVQLPDRPAGANTMVFYYKAYMEFFAANNPQGEDGSSYAWGANAFFGLSFSGSVSSNTGVVGFSNGDSPWVMQVFGPQQYAPFSNGSGYSSVEIVNFGAISTNFYHGPAKQAFSMGNQNFGGGRFCPTTRDIGVVGAKKYLGIIQIARHQENVQQVVFSYGNNWENLAVENFRNALSSTLSNWAFRNVAVNETTNFRPNHASSDPALRSTINFPGWIVMRWPTAIVGRNLVITDIKVEYYD